MLKYRIALIIVLIGCVAIVACNRTQDKIMTVMDDPEEEMMDMDDMMDMVMEMDAHKSWESKDLEAPMMTVEEAAAAMNAAGTGQAHGTGVRTVYFNEAAAMTNKSDGAKMYPAGSMIVKEVMNDDKTEIVQVVTMAKTDDPMYMERGGWIYGVGGNNLTLEMSMGCDECHAKAGEGNDYVFVKLMMDDMDDMSDDDADDTSDDGDAGNGDAMKGDDA